MNGKDWRSEFLPNRWDQGILLPRYTTETCYQYYLYRRRERPVSQINGGLERKGDVVTGCYRSIVRKVVELRVSFLLYLISGGPFDITCTLYIYFS